MSIDYASVAATATRLLTDDGQPMTLRRTIPGTYDPVTGTTTGGSTQDLPTTGVFTKISTTYALTNQVESGDRMVLIDGSQKPQMTDKLIVDGDVFTIINPQAVNPAGTAIAYKLQVRGQ